MDLLGVKASQLLQSNVVIWIEGPSDRIYLNCWISLLSPNLKEGKHYSYVMYGGALLDYYSVFVNDVIMVDNKFLDIMRTSRYAFLVADRDRDQGDESLKPRLKKITDKINSLNSIEKKYIKYHKTEGREIENYVSEEIFTNALCHEVFKRDSVSYKTKTKTIKLDNPSVTNLSDDFTFTMDDSFDIKFTKLYLTKEIIEEHNLNPITNKSIYDEVTKKLTQKFKKVVVAEQVVKYYNVKEDIGSQESYLYKFVTELVEFINSAQ